MSSAGYGHRCEPITQAQRYHVAMRDDARWHCTYQRRSKTSGVRAFDLYLTDRDARHWCARNLIPFPGRAASDPAPIDTSARTVLVPDAPTDRKAQAAGPDSE